MFVSPIPINTIGWGMGALALLLFGYKSWSGYKDSGSYLNKYFGLFGFVMGAAFILLSVPSFFTKDTDVLRATYLASDLLVYTGFMLQVPILWFVGLKNRVRLSFLLTLAVSIAAVAWVDNVRHFDVVAAGKIVEFYDSVLSLQLQTSLLLLIIIPIGLFFLVQATKGLLGRRRKQLVAKPFVIGIAYVVVGSIVAVNNMQDRGLDSVESGLTNIVVFTAMIIALLLPSAKRRG